MLRYDLIIVGGGLVGAGLAIALRHTGLNMALIEAKLPSTNDPRLFALNSSSCQFLENLGLWHRLAQYASPIKQVHVSKQGRYGALRLHSEEVNLSSLGNVIPACYIEEILNEELTLISNCTLYRPAKLCLLQPNDHGATLRIVTDAGEINLRAPIVIGADGAESTVRTQLNIPTEIFDYEQSAMVTKTILKRSHRQIAYERFTPQGVIAMLPLIDNECATIWTGPSKILSQLIELSDEAFLQKLQTEFGYRLGRLQGISKRYIFPLRMVRAKKNLEQCVYLLGNSAHTLHPIAAQGFNLALYEVAVMVEVIMARIKKQEVITTDDLEIINLRTQKRQANSIGISHRLAQVSSSDSLLLSFIIQLGMFGLELATPIKKKFLKRMMGRIGHAPSLLLDGAQ